MPPKRRPSRAKKRKPSAAELRATLLARAEAGDAEAQFALGQALLEAEEPDAHAALRCLTPSAEQGHEPARGGPADLAQASTWLRQAAAAGHLEAMKLLADHMVRGDLAAYGIPRDWNTAAGWYERAAEAGDVPAMVRFGWLLAENEPVSTDIFVQGLAWLKAAARLGNAEGQYLYALALRRYEEEAEARVWLTRAADEGWAPAQALLDTL